MARQSATPESAEDRALREVEQEDQSALASLAAQAGSPPEAERLSEADEDTAWETEDPLARDHEAVARQLATQGLPPETAQRLLITKLRPEWAPLYAQPTSDLGQADLLARAARWPFRLSLLDGYDDPEQAVRKAESLDRRYQKRHTQRQEQAAQMQVGMPGTNGYAGSEHGGAP